VRQEQERRARVRSGAAPMTRLDIHSDVVCPWCYLGAANLLKALATREGAHPFAIRWHPFRLDPTIPPEGLDRDAYMRGKFGDVARLADSHARLVEMGRDAGLDFRFERITRAPNTLDAHRLIRWAAPESLQTRVAMVLFRRYFELGEDISDHAVLRSGAEEAGLDGAAIARLLASDADRDEVAAEARAAADMGITGVPTFIVAGRYAVSGAQPSDVWTRLMDELDASRPPEGK
jgi:predicted DsbA family dithiol-disulfide isomerase